LFLAEITESTEMAAFGLGLLRSWYVSQKSQRAQKGFRLTAKRRSHRNHGKHRKFYSLTLMVCFTQKFIFADAHILFHTEITEITEKAAFGLALLRSWYLSQKSRRAQKGFRLTAKMRSHRNHGKHRNFYSLTLINYFTQKSQKTQKLAFGKGLTHAIIIRDARSCLKKEL